MRANTALDFWAKIAVGEPEACWEWQPKSRDQDGYGVFKFEGRQWRTHRLAYTLAVAPIPDDLHVLHRCDNPPCGNPAHLFLGTAKDNNADRDQKGRHRVQSGDAHWTRRIPGALAGENSPSTKLTSAQVRDMRSRYAAGATKFELGEMFGIAPETARKIVQGQRWRDSA